jgi:hypothetical protein
MMLVFVLLSTLASISSKSQQGTRIIKIRDQEPVLAQEVIIQEMDHKITKMPVGQMVSQEMVSTKEEFQVINR